MTTAIQADALTKRWGDFTAVDNLNLTVHESECYSLLGRNGAGKSTTARMLLDLIRPTSGRAQLLGGHGSDAAIRDRVGYLPGDLDLPRSMTANDAFNFYGGLHGPSDPSVRDSLIARFDLDPSRRVRDMSTGNRRKVGLILAFMGTPQLLILDEPTSGLDPVLQEEFRDLLAERKADGATIWLTSHVMAEVARVADRVGLINDGKIVKELTSEELSHQATTGITFGFEKPVASSSFDGVASVTAVRQDGTDMVVSLNGTAADVLKRAAELDAVRVETEQNDLDAIFIHLLSGGDSS